MAVHVGTSGWELPALASRAVPGRAARGGAARTTAGKNVFAYFNNDGNANAVRNARTLNSLLRL